MTLRSCFIIALLFILVLSVGMKIRGNDLDSARAAIRGLKVDIEDRDRQIENLRWENANLKQSLAILKRN